MLRATPPLRKMASTKGGLRRILKRKLPVARYIELATKAGSYKTPSDRPHYLGLQDVPPASPLPSAREREMRAKLLRGIIDYPSEYEILSLNPPLPLPPYTPKNVLKADVWRRKKALMERERQRKRRGLPPEAPPALPSMDHLVRSYLHRHEEKMRAGMTPTQARRDEEYYARLLLGRESVEEARERAQEKLHVAFKNPSSLHTIMGRKSATVENAYAFALQQMKVMRDGAGREGGIPSEEASAAQVEERLAREARESRREGRDAADATREWRKVQEETGKDGTMPSVDGDSESDDVTDTLPSILHNRPRAVRAMGVWSARLRAVPYSQWTVGAATALDHWIARDILRMGESTWQQLLEGGGTYAAGMETLPGGETRAGLTERMRHIATVRGALFPETTLDGEAAAADADAGSGSKGMDGPTGDLDEGLLSGGEDESATEKSIDELLASLGELDDDDDDNSWKFIDDDDDKKEENEAVSEGGMGEEREVTSILEELQVWRTRNASSPYEAWDVDRKQELDIWIEKYVTTVYPEADAASVDKEATRISLLSERPIGTEKTKEFWSKAREETEAEAFLSSYRKTAEEKLESLKQQQQDESSSSQLKEEEIATMYELEAILSVPFDAQLQKIINMGTLRPLLDEYAPSAERELFLEKYAHILLEGVEMEHLVLDPEGAIGPDDIAPDLREELSRDWTPSPNSAAREPRFSIQMVAYGTDEFGLPRAERARELYRLWNEHKASRARFEEALFKRGYLGVEEDGIRTRKKGKRK